jgi:phytoene dehydrogenase-like protein
MVHMTKEHPQAKRSRQVNLIRRSRICIPNLDNHTAQSQQNDATIVANEYNKGDKSVAPSGGKAFHALQTAPTSKNVQERQ